MFRRGPDWRERMPFDCGEECRTEQGHRELVDINNIVRRYARDGLIPPPTVPPQYADVTKLQLPLQERMEFADRTLSAAEQFLSTRAPEAPVVVDDSVSGAVNTVSS